MIELLVLFALAKKELTMYGVKKMIAEHFGAYTAPSFGALNPVLKRLVKNNYLKIQSTMSEGGRPSCLYTITPEGIEEFKNLILEDYSDNPIQFFSNARIKLSCVSFLNEEEASKLYLITKSNAMRYKTLAENILNNEYTELTYSQRIVLDNSICEYQNFITLIENLEKNNACNS